MAKFKPHQWTTIGSFAVRTRDQQLAARIVVNELDGLVAAGASSGYSAEGYEWMRLSAFREEMIRTAKPRK